MYSTLAEIRHVSVKIVGIRELRSTPPELFDLELSWTSPNPYTSGRRVIGRGLLREGGLELRFGVVLVAQRREVELGAEVEALGGLVVLFCRLRRAKAAVEAFLIGHWGSRCSSGMRSAVAEASTSPKLGMIGSRLPLTHGGVRGRCHHLFLSGSQEP